MKIAQAMVAAAIVGACSTSGTGTSGGAFGADNGGGSNRVGGGGATTCAPAATGFQQFYKCMGAWSSLGDQGSEGACLTACLTQTSAEGCWFLDGTGGFPRDCRICADGPPAKGTFANDWGVGITCGSSNSLGDGGSSLGGGMDAGSGACGVEPPASDGGVCNTLVSSGPLVTIQCQPGATMPPPTGGTIADGTYVLTSSIYYTSTCPTQTTRSTWSICGSRWESVQQMTGSSALTINATATATGPGELALQVTCGPPQTVTFGYDATPTTLRLHVGTTVLTTYTRQ